MKTRRNTGVGRWVRGTIAVGAVACLMGACVSQAMAGLTQGPVRGNGVVVTTDDDGSATVVFKAIGIPSPRGCTLQAVSKPNGTLPSDYLSAGIANVAFTMTCDQARSGNARAILASSGRVWTKWFNVSSAVDTPVAYSIGVSADEPWILIKGSSEDFAAAWQEDLANITAVGLYIDPPSMIAKTYEVASFQLVDANGTSYGANLTALELALKRRFGVTSLSALSDAQKAADDDGDGMTSVDEIRSENDQDFADSIFAAEIVSSDENGVTIRWACVDAEEYGIRRAASLLSGFQPLVDALVATETGYMYYTDGTATGEGPYFYTIVRDNK